MADNALIDAMQMLVETFNTHSIPYQLTGPLADIIDRSGDVKEIVGAAPASTLAVEIPQSQMEFAAYLLRQYKSGPIEFAEQQSFKMVFFRLSIQTIEAEISQGEHKQIKSAAGWVKLAEPDWSKSEIRAWRGLKLKIQPLERREQIKAIVKI